MIRVYILFFIVAIFLSFGINRYFEQSFQKKLDIQAKQSLLKVKSIYNAVIDTYMVAAQKDLYNLTSNEKIMKLLKKYKYADLLEKNNIRGNIFRYLHEQYSHMKALHVRQFHLHTHRGDSLLRFHLPYKSGDSLIDVRASIYKANVEHKVVFGFEGGRAYPGYRYVFPLFMQDEHIGSVEFSISFEGIESKLKKLMPDDIFQLIMTKESSIERVFEWHKSFFSVSNWNENYYEETASLSMVNQNIQNNDMLKRIAQKIKNKSNLNHLFSKKKSFSTYEIIDGNGYIINFFAFNNTNDIHAGYIVSITNDNQIVYLNNELFYYKVIANIVSILILLLLVFLQKKITQIRKFHNRLERFIDLQEAIVILTNGKDFIFANKSFYSFFGYANIDAFKKDYSCICDHFIVHNNFFSIGMVKNNEDNWIESLINLPDRNRIVSMLDYNKVPHAFSVGINTYDKDTYVINFTDISDTMIEKLQLEQQAARDMLTNAYNRTYFQNSIGTIRALIEEQKLQTGIIYFDIDYFKDINDTYGHDIGDAVLKELVQLINKNLRNKDQLIRWGGEEFIIVLGVDSINNLFKFAEKICKRIELHSFTGIKKLTCSFGISIGNEDTEIETIISDADKKLYEAKESGRNKVCY